MVDIKDPTDTKKVLGEIAKFKKNLKAAEENLKKLENFQKKQSQVLEALGRDIQKAAKDVADSSRAIKSGAGALKSCVERAKNLDSDVEMQLRRYMESQKEIEKMKKDLSKLDLKHHDKPQDAGIARKYEIARKAFEKAMNAHIRLYHQTMDFCDTNAELDDLVNYTGPQVMKAMKEFEDGVRELEKANWRGYGLSRTLDRIFKA